MEIAKALSQEASLLIMDEPTASLGMEEVARLHDIVRNLARQGCAVIYISHRLDEVVDLVDTVTVMKDGRIVANEKIANIDVNRIVSLMIGGDFRTHYPKERNTTGEVLISVEEIRTARGVRGASFRLHRGEVLGLAGLIGTGRTSIAHALFGIDRITAGRILRYTSAGEGRDSRFVSPHEAISNGVALLTEDRKSTGLFMNFTGVHNISIARLSQISRRGILDLGKEQTDVQRHFEKLRITPTARDRSVQYLSGGNQQKIIIARWIFSEADVFILDEPTQGIDVGAKVEVYNLINRLTREGKGRHPHQLRPRGAARHQRHHLRREGREDRGGEECAGDRQEVPDGEGVHTPGRPRGLPARRARSMARRVTSSSIIGPVVATAVVTLLVGLTTDRFFMVENLRNLALQVSIVSLVGIGSTLVIITGGIDLSPGPRLPCSR